MKKYGVCRRCHGAGYIRVSHGDGSTDISLCPVCNGEHPKILEKISNDEHVFDEGSEDITKEESV